MCRRVVGGLILVGLSFGDASAIGGDDTQSRPFDSANVRFEQNVTDGDVEVVFEVSGGDEGLTKLTVVAPDARRVVDFAAPDISTLGIRKFHFESPEPKDVEELKIAYPEGAYTFAGTNIAGGALYAESTLYHQLPSPTSILLPSPRATNVPTEHLEIAWKPVENVADTGNAAVQHRPSQSFASNGRICRHKTKGCTHRNVADH